MKNKFILLLSACIITCLPAFAQLRAEDEEGVHPKHERTEEDVEAAFRYNGHDYSLGFGLGSTHMYGNLPVSNPQPAYMCYIEKNIWQYFSAGVQITVGDLSSRYPKIQWYSFNHFTSIDEHVSLQLGALFSIFDRDYNDNLVTRIFGGFYGGIGIGVINNDIKRIANVSLSQLYHTTPLTDNPIIEKNSVSLYFPFNFGYSYRVQKFLCFDNGFVFNTNFQLNDCQSDYVDGYSPPFPGHKHTPVYTIMSIGAKFYITRKEPGNLFFDQ